MFRIKQNICYGVLCFFIVLPNFAEFSQGTAEQNVKYSVVHSWAEKLGLDLWLFGDFITRRKEVQESFKQAQVVPRLGPKIVEYIATEIKLMMDLKISAVKRIMDTAENTALSHQHDKPDVRFAYYNAKEMIQPGETPPTEPPRDFDDSGVPKIIVPPKEIVLTPRSEFFDVAVNTTVSSVHIPTNVFDRAENVIKDIKWSENLDKTFQDNYKNDPTLSWQFFGSSTGFMRQFPASKWEQDPVDLYDCRLRSWYIEAATSPKDVVVLMDSSGSMTGQRGDVAKHVVNTILDTLGTNDFVNVFKFSESVVPVVPCFRDILVQATLGNVREFKLGLEEFETTSIANFTAALTKAFEILEVYRTESLGAHCNQAIMLISDGAPFSCKEIFEQFNWQNLPYMPVRVFTYLIGKEVADVKEIKWMACANQGFYVHLSDLAEVREMVLNYIPVMARPLVLGKHDHPVVWTQVYADVVDPKMTDWLWEVKQCEEQKSYYVNLREQGYTFFSREEEQKRALIKEKKNLEQYTDSEDYQFMTTVAMPVYDRRENANITEEVLINEAYWETITRETKIANLLGVAGTDVPIRDIKKLLMPFMLGVNGYAFIVTNNGYILIHPDLRPIFQDILKPAYNSVDLLEVELLDDDSEPRDFNPVLLGIRDSIINQSTGSKWMMVKQHYDKMKRVTRIKRQYFWTPIQNTPFTLVVTFPEQYGINRLQVRSEDEIHRLHVKGSNMLGFFSGRNWKIHPEWLYCKQSNKTFSSPEMELLYFLEEMKKPGWKWPLKRTSLPPEHTAAMYCDRSLMQSLVFDARVTEWFTNTSFGTKDDKRNEFKQRFGITVAFLATHSGLTRWQEFHTNVADEIRPEQEFSDANKRATDEIWYKRAVEQHFVEPQSFVYSVPFESDENPREILVTASHAIFHSEGGKSAPAAVVGFQFQHSALYTLFKNITGNCTDCKKTCASDEIDCYILDNDGYVIISPSKEDTGKFFGEVNGNMMFRLIEEKIYKEVIIYDYQAICFDEKSNENGSSKLLSPLMHMFRLFKWVLRTIWYFIQVQMTSVKAMDNYFDDNSTDYNSNNKDWQKKVVINRTRLQSCDHVIHLYSLYNEKDKSLLKKPASGCERPFVAVPIPASNLLLLVVDAICPRTDPPVRLTTKPVPHEYPNATLACHKPQYPRIRPVSCINKHMNESSIELCGRASSIVINFSLVVIAFVFILVLQR